MEKERIQKILSSLGVCSRRKAEALVSEGKVKVNDVLVTEAGFKCLPTDKIEVEGHLIQSQDNGYVYLKLNKPDNVVTTASDPQNRKTVLDFVPSSYGRLFPVGRLDQNSTGLLILTNDGEFANLVTHPSTAPEKEYSVLGKNKLYGDEVQRLAQGLYITKEGYSAKPAKATVTENNIDSVRLSIIIHEGKKREIRHMMETLGHPVITLERIRIGNIHLGNLGPGQIEEIDPFLIQELKDECKANKRKGAAATPNLG